MRAVLDLSQEIDHERGGAENDQTPASESSGDDVGDLSGLEVLLPGLIPAEEQHGPSGDD